MTTTRISGTISKGLSGPGLGEDEFEADLITGSVDLEGDVTPASGANPSSGTIPLLWNHDPARVVGVARYTRVGNKLVLRCTLIPKGTTPEGDLARVCAKADFGLGMSAGYQPTDVVPIKGTRGKTYKQYRLLEASLVAVPCDQSARITARAHDAERAERLTKARAAALGNIAPTEEPNEFTGMSKAERVAYAKALTERGQESRQPAPPSTMREAEVKRACEHAYAALAAHRAEHPTRDDRLVLAGLANSKDRPAGY
jgi:hypothetical protein